MSRQHVRFASKDSNHDDIVRDYERAYCNVVDLHALGIEGVPDLLVAMAGRAELVEIKTTDGELLPSQILFAKTWRGPKIVIARTQADVARHVADVYRRVARG